MKATVHNSGSKNCGHSSKEYGASKDNCGNWVETEKCNDCDRSETVDHGKSKDRRIIHFHGRKSVLNVDTCNKYFKPIFHELLEKNEANIGYDDSF